MDLNLANKVYIITGGASGIGRAISELIALEGGTPVIVGNDPDSAEMVVNDIISKGGQAFSIDKELGSPQSCREVVDAIHAKFSDIHGLVNNAGLNDGVSLEKGSPQAWLDSLEKNLHHYFYMAHYCLPQLIRTRGTIVNISSKTALTGQGHTSAYAAAKGAQLALTREWAVELLKYGIRVNAIVPAEVKTPLYEAWLKKFDDPEGKQRQIEEKIPLGNRMTSPEEIADMAVFLLSDRASHITGQHLSVDGGYVHLDRSSQLLNS